MDNREKDGDTSRRDLLRFAALTAPVVGLSENTSGKAYALPDFVQLGQFRYRLVFVAWLTKRGDISVWRGRLQYDGFVWPDDMNRSDPVLIERPWELRKREAYAVVVVQPKRGRALLDRFFQGGGTSLAYLISRQQSDTNDQSPQIRAVRKNQGAETGTRWLKKLLEAGVVGYGIAELVCTLNRFRQSTDELSDRGESSCFDPTEEFEFTSALPSDYFGYAFADTDLVTVTYRDD